MMRRLLTIAVLALSCAGLVGTATAAASAGGSNPPPKCFRTNAAGDLPTCRSDGGGTWTVSYDDGFAGGGAGGGGIPSGFIALFVIAAIAGLGVTIWRVSMARNLARQAGMSPNQATAVTLLGNEGLDAAYLASNLRGSQASAPSSATSPPRSTADRLNELQQLKDQGLVTAAEYDARRKAIVDSV